VAKELSQAGLPHDIKYNLVYKGGYITQRYTNYSKPEQLPTKNLVQSFQVEYNMALTHNYENLELLPNRCDQLREIFEKVFAKVLSI
jgi:hypothetical protein